MGVGLGNVTLITEVSTWRHIGQVNATAVGKVSLAYLGRTILAIILPAMAAHTLIVVQVYFVAARGMRNEWGLLDVVPAQGSGIRVDLLHVPGILNFSQIDNAEALPGPKVGFGGATEPAAMPWLAEQEFATVINLRLATEAGAEVDPSRAAAEAVGLRYLHLPFNDEATPANEADGRLWRRSASGRCHRC